LNVSYLLCSGNLFKAFLKVKVQFYVSYPTENVKLFEIKTINCLYNKKAMLGV